jgi:quinol monooxygenase YgiN
MLIITDYMHVDLADLAQFRADLTALAAATGQRIENISNNAAINDPETRRLLIMERWADQATLSAYLAAADTIAFVERWHGRMQGEFGNTAQRTSVSSWNDVCSSVFSVRKAPSRDKP